MTLTDDEIQRRLTLERYPRSAKYPGRWLIDNAMGPNPIWLAEALSEVMPLEPGMRVLDMGCGTALTSVFLAKEFDVQVWATDLWIKPTENWQRVREQGVADRVYPIYGEAHALPYADGFFDAAVSFDAYHYFGTDACYLREYVRYVRPGGPIGIVVPGFVAEPEVLPPPHLESWWGPDFGSFHSPAWWNRHWSQTGLVTVETADHLPDGWENWLLWDKLCNVAAGRPEINWEVEMLLADEGRTLTFSRVVARRNTDAA